MRYFDAHTHANFAAYAEDREAVIARARETGVGMNVVGTQFDTSKAAALLAEAHEGVYATIGLHPIHTSKSYHDEKELGAGNKEFASRGEQFDMDAYLALGRSPRVVAVGECGLDYYRIDKETKEIQVKNFIAQIECANQLGKPLMLHVRPSKGSMDAYLDALEILQAHATVKGDSHFFAGDWGVARKYLDFGFTLSFTGVLTFARDYDEVVRNAPLDMILSETDAPYVTPAPYRGERNEPVHVREVVKAIARIRGSEEEACRSAILDNSRRVFGF